MPTTAPPVAKPCVLCGHKQTWYPCQNCGLPGAYGQHLQERRNQYLADLDGWLHLADVIIGLHRARQTISRLREEL